MEPYFENTIMADDDEDDDSLIQTLLSERTLIIASNRGPVTFNKDAKGELVYQRGTGGLVTALTGVTRQAEARWVACARTEEDKIWGEGFVPGDETSEKLWVQFISPTDAQYEGYYNVISNPLLWFLQHSMWDIFREPTIDRAVWEHWEHGYVAVNQLFAEAIAAQIACAPHRALVMLQDYHLYLAPGFIRHNLRPENEYTLAHFIHIPWPGTEDWGVLPAKMRQAILEGLCALDLLGFQTKEDGMNFLRTCETYLPEAQVSFKYHKVWFRDHATYVRDFPISIDVDALKEMARDPQVYEYYDQLTEHQGDQKTILRIDRIEPSKNIVRGFQSFNEMLDLHPEYIGKVRFLALLVPSRLEVEKYGNYLDEIMGVAGRINAKFGNTNWEPIRILVGENYPRAVAGLQMYNVLLVNSIADGMNLVAKEGPIVNLYNGVLVLSDRTGAFRQLEAGALIVSPLDITGTAEALHQALSMPLEERQEKSEFLQQVIEKHDIANWLIQQFEEIVRLDL
jgi:trehalose 6-phosphate synthase